MPVEPTTTSTANACFAEAVAKFGNEAALDLRQHCGLPMNNATHRAAGSEAYVACFGAEMRACPAGTDAHAAGRAAAQACTARR